MTRRVNPHIITIEDVKKYAKEKIRNSILGILAFVLLFYEIIVLKGENYYLVSMAVLLIALFGFFAHFEKERWALLCLR